MSMGMTARNRVWTIIWTSLSVLFAIVLIYAFLWMVGAAFKTNEEIFVNHHIIPSGKLVWYSFARGWK